MLDETSLLNIGELSKPATVLVEKISDAIGGIFKPWQIRRVAQAETEVEKIKAVSQIEIDELHQRALERFVAEEAIKQRNIESITAKALPQIEESAMPQYVENDWIANFFDTPINIEFEKENDNELHVGSVLLSKVGQELASICGSKSIPEFSDYVIED